MGVDPTDLVGNKRFLAFFAGGMLPIISLSFLHMLVKFTEEDRLKEDEETPPSNPEDLKNFVDETARLHLTENDLMKLEETLLNPPKPNDNLKSATEYYKMKTDIEREKRGELLAEMMKNDQEMGLYDEPFDNTSDWDVTLMDGLEDEEPFFTEEEMENILQEEPTEEEIQRNFSTIEPKTEKILQEEPTTTANNKIFTTIEQHKKNGYKVSQIPEDDERMNIIGQNGNEGLHYDNEEDTSLEKNDEKKN
jgi:DNA-binding transcriptional regulator YhcF (GntR family)